MYVIVDIETTGLDPVKNIMLELGIMLVNDEFQIMAKKYWLIKNDGFDPLLDCDDFISDMHGTSGLIADVMGQNAMTLQEVEREAIDWIVQHGAENEPMCGSSIHFDRAFIQRYLPAFEDIFHYRNIDVSTIKNMAERFNPAVFDGRPQGSKTHRALPDCEDTRAELEYYAENFFIKGA